MDDKFLREQYGLKERVIDVFSQKIAKKEYLEFWINREKELKEWGDILKKSIRIQKNFVVFIIGSYGRGKTLSLLKIVDEVEKNFSESIFPVYLSFIGEEKPSKPGLDFIFRIFKAIDFEKLVIGKNSKIIQNAVKNITNKLDEPQKILQNIYLQGKQNGSLLNINVANENKKLAIYFIRGEIKPTTSQLKKLGIMRKIENIDVAKEYLAAILCFMRNLGYKSLLLAIDEFEYLFSIVSKTQHSIYLALLRGLYDFPMGLNIESDKLANMVFFIGISEDGWSKLQDIEKKEISEGGPTQPLMQRIDLETTLLNFDKEQAKKLIEKVLSYNRITKDFEKDPLIPFTEDFVEYIYEVTSGVPRFIKEKCAPVLDAGLANKVPLLDREFAQKVLKERGF